MRIRAFGGFAVEHDGVPVEIVGARQRALLFRLALDAGTPVSYRALGEDLWPVRPPENVRASLQSLVARLRPQLPDAVLESIQGGYRLAIDRADMDVLAFQDLVARARAAESGDPFSAVEAAGAALSAWTGAPWSPGEGYDWFTRDLERDRTEAERIAAGNSAALRAAVRPASTPNPAAAMPLTRLIGRDAELELVGAQLRTSRLVTVLGTGGAGKTRLATELALRRPAVFVELAPATDDEVAQAVLGAVGRDIRSRDELGSRGPGARALIVEALAGRETTLVLDNCEHVIAAAAEFAGWALAELPRLSVLATSREPLGVPGEAFVPLGPLEESAAETLFAERVQQARGAAPGDDEREEAARIRRRLDGLPLALELAAARARTMTLAEIADGLDDRFALLSGGMRGALPRHRTLRSLVDWSWELLGEGERRALMVLAAYPAGVAAGDARRVCAAHGIAAADLDALVDRSLLRRVAGRYRALETIREYGLERLAESGSGVRVRDEQAEAMADACEREDRRLRSADCMAALTWFDEEDDNVAAALRWCADRAGHGEGSRLVRLTAANGWYWVLRDRNADAVAWTRLAAPFAEDDDSDAGVLVRLIGSMVDEDDLIDPDGRGVDENPERVAEFLDRVRGLGPREADLLQVLPVLADAVGSALTGGPVTLELPDDEQTRSPWVRAALRTFLAAFAHNTGDVARLGELTVEAVARFEAIGDPWGTSLARQLRSEWLVFAGRFEEALDLSERATADMRRITSVWDLQAQQGLAVRLLVRLGRVEEARKRAERLVTEARESGASGAIAQSALTLVMLHLGLGEREEAARVLAGAEESIAELPGRVGQLRAVASLARALIAAPEAPAAAREHLRVASELAAQSRDQPVMASVVVGIGTVALGEGDLATVATALETARRLRGAPDPADPFEGRLAAALVSTANGALEAAAATTEAGTAPALGPASALLQIFLR